MSMAQETEQDSAMARAVARGEEIVAELEALRPSLEAAQNLATEMFERRADLFWEAQSLEPKEARPSLRRMSAVSGISNPAIAQQLLVRRKRAAADG